LEEQITWKGFLGTRLGTRYSYQITLMFAQS
jgi:hypothetical protein